jgi:hypothetical protein
MTSKQRVTAKDIIKWPEFGEEFGRDGWVSVRDLLQSLRGWHLLEEKSAKQALDTACLKHVIGMIDDLLETEKET